jgi:hypothetical protein
MYIKEAARPYLIPIICFSLLMAGVYYLVKKFKNPRTN